jgi:RNA polymerase sigma factor (sigma-70 family)
MRNRTKLCGPPAQGGFIGTPLPSGDIRLRESFRHRFLQRSSFRAFLGNRLRRDFDVGFGKVRRLYGEMNGWSDVQLLRAYVAERNEAAFRELVTRHTDLVFCSALRQVRDHDEARDIAQIVFVDLARKAGSILQNFGKEASLAGWVYSAVRFAALNQLRAERRREAREKDVILESGDASVAIDWDQLSLLLDSAMADLPKSDREAVILRYFKKHGFREIAANFGISEDAAQKRVSRALNRLRRDLARRGLAASMGGLSAALAANSIAAAPVELAEILSTTALSSAAGTSSIVVAAGKMIAITTMQKSMITAAVLVAVGLGVYQANQSARLKSEVAELNQRARKTSAPPGDDSRKELENALGKLAALQRENQTLKRGVEEIPRLRGELARALQNMRELSKLAAGQNDPFVREALQWKANEARLRQLFEDRPDQRIPEMQLVDNEAWLNHAKSVDFDSESGVRKALAEVRRYGRNRFVNTLSEALAKYVATNDGRLPNNVSDLKSYFEKPVADEMLEQYFMAYKGTLKDVPPGGWVVTNKVVDPEYDTRWGVGPGSYGLMPDSPERADAAAN